MTTAPRTGRARPSTYIHAHSLAASTELLGCIAHVGFLFPSVHAGRVRER
jgi:hypothetical protein